MVRNLRGKIAADAKKLIDMDGVQISYTIKGGSAANIFCIPRSTPLEPTETDDQLTLEIKCWIAVSKADLPTVVINGDVCAAPGEWTDQAGTVTYRVAIREHDRSHPGYWLLGLK